MAFFNRLSEFLTVSTTVYAPMIAIIDYGMGNLRSVEKALERTGHAATITGDPAVLAEADKIVLPGVGAFRDAIAALGERRLVEPIRAAIAAGKPFLGICLGLQLLFDKSYEDGEYEGLGILPGEVVRFDVPAELKVPHMGWNQAHVRRRPHVFDGIDDGAYFYFVHSYHVVPRDPSVIATETDYGALFCSSIWRDNLVAVQFHPEKSQDAGLRLLKNFAESG
jgi:imidazole glycerol-phosphate synthase subunit HisH